ncbi:MAG: hypothetical protein LBI02_04540 [Opitutaceae bacterium]|nr:hypothetical protein [Opitutaceae bacterium]
MKTIRMGITVLIFSCAVASACAAVPTCTVASVCAAASACAAADPSGVWKFEFEGAQGRKLESTLTLKLDGGRLTGVIDNRGGKVKISDAKFEGDRVSFNVVHNIRRREFVTSYSGRLDGDTIKGTVSTRDRDGRMRSREWEAKRPSE